MASRAIRQSILDSPLTRAVRAPRVAPELHFALAMFFRLHVGQRLLNTGTLLFDLLSALTTIDLLEETSFLRHWLLPPAQELLCRVGAGNEEVYLGRDGWLFYRFDVDHLTYRWSPA